jgi:hypothetical protein
LSGAVCQLFLQAFSFEGSTSSTCQRSPDWQKALILNSPYPPNLLLDQLGVAPSPPGTIQQHNNLIHNLPLHYLEQRGTPTSAFSGITWSFSSLLEMLWLPERGALSQGMEGVTL